MGRPLINERIREIAAQVAADSGLELVHIEEKGAGSERTLRLFIDKPGGVSVEDCSEVSRRFGDLLDAEDLIDAEYILEVSSPGLERELYSLRDFEKFSGSPARVKTKTPVDGQKNFRGRILSVENGLIFFDDRTNGKLSFPYDIVLKANLEFDLEAELKRK
ncbi:MAG: ribosome maturation factor RimP [Acidobacteria bacterium]|nr:ribosome maturation factor RimP [Acidobacteriota bacterium]